MSKCRICQNEINNRTFTVKEMLFATHEPFDYIECGACGCLQIVAVPDDLSKYYPDDYFPFKEKVRKTSEGLKYQVKRFLSKWMLKQPKLFSRISIPETFKPLLWLFPCDINHRSHIIDIGCGPGKCLQSLARLGFQYLQGVDPYIAESKQLGSKVAIQKCWLREVTGQYDFAMMHHSFEHMPNPLEVLHDLYRILKPGAYALIRIPVANCYAFRHYGPAWVAWDPPRHLYLHTTHSMQYLCEQVGFHITDVIYDSTSFQFVASEQYKENIPLTTILDKLKTLYPKKKIKIWEKQAKILNELKEGDQACFYLMKPWK